MYLEPLLGGGREGHAEQHVQEVMHGREGVEVRPCFGGGGV